MNRPRRAHATPARQMSPTQPHQPSQPSPQRDRHRPTLAFDATGFHTSFNNGLNRYTQEAIAALEDFGELRLFSGDRALCHRLGRHGRHVPLGGLHQNNLRGNLSRLLWHQTALPAILSRARSTPLFYSPVPEGMLLPVCPQILTVHDLLPLEFPEVYPRVKYYFRWILPRLLRASRAIVVPSDHTRRELLRYWPTLKTPCAVLPVSYRADLFFPAPTARYADTASMPPFVLCVGETRPYKNIRRAIEAFARVVASGQRPTLTLAIVGQLNRLDTAIAALPQQLGIADRVQFLGYVSDTDLADLYRRAAAFLFPSLYEGFGIPPLEAMACGCPTIVSRAASMPEVCGDAPHYIDPHGVEDIATGIVRVTGDRAYAQTLRSRGLDRVQSFQPNHFRHGLQAIVIEHAPDYR
ncbi:MAG: glycosyltransferase family 4 protein [Geitlerinemataceae cyanobacterium]